MRLRNKNFKPNGEYRCSRCSRTERLETDHIKPLSRGGLDITDNLQWLCYVCHKFKTARDMIVYNMRGKPDWHIYLYQGRLEALENANPPGQNTYVSYWDDPKKYPKAQYGYWYRRRNKIGLQTLEDFSERIMG